MANDSQAPKRRTKPFSRLQWSARGVTIYGSDGFITRLEDGRDIGFLEALLVSGLRKISTEQQARRAFHAAHPAAPQDMTAEDRKDYAAMMGDPVAREVINLIEEEAPDEEPLTPI